MKANSGFFIICSFIICCIISLCASKPQDVVDQSLLKVLKTKSQVDVIVSLKEGVSKTLAQFQRKSLKNPPESRNARIEELHSALISNAEESQKEIKNLIKTKGFSYQSFWITNKLIIHNADLELVEQLSLLPSIDEIREPIISTIHQTVPATSAPPTVIQWGVSKIGAPQFWNTGFRGQGVVVALIDTGVRGNHSILKSNFVGTNGWFDPYEQTPYPNDGQGHGTHCAGTIVGQDGYGVAPEAKWMACKGCNNEGACYEYATLDCGQFVFCPTDTMGNNRNCSLAPKVASNSWGGQDGRNFYDDVIRVWHAAGIIPVFSAGNEGSDCSTVSSPGDRDVIGVGATDVDDYLTWFSSRGPSVTGVIKPDICAPGFNISSASHLFDDSFVAKSGTSMAAPHLAGAIALLLSKHKNLDYAQIKDSLFKGANTVILYNDVTQRCGNISDTVFPNNAFGNGFLDVVRASEFAETQTTTTKAPALTTPNSSKVNNMGFLCFFTVIFQMFILM